MAEDKGWILDELVRMPAIRTAVVASGDGMLIAHEKGLPRDDAERWAAASAVLQSCARNGMEPVGYPAAGFRRTVVEHEQGYQLVQEAANGAYLVVATGPDADLGVVAVRMQEVTQRLGKELVSPARRATGPQ
ncbi:dynein regulation protein LC7 [Amycolatopsis antarctica]|uniref:Dynein regulation protein LC7 n=1 Tax=Amycolatopsis antarctica TaxID=1854586 RepID=A0A263D3R7_9PSEU|nr:roadblock/LC7 domain-containing protein [Amycolatopsis antarctica]OZM72267.1 dynein regulation protein LC7 [Amycolatopsis antarctica]